MKRNTSNWSNFGMLLRRAGLTASAGLSCLVNGMELPWLSDQILASIPSFVLKLSLKLKA